MKKEQKKQIPNAKVQKLDDFEFGKIIGEGAFGRVRKCYQQEEEEQPTNSLANSLQKSMAVDSRLKRKKEAKLFAAKLQSKYQLIKSKQEEHVLNEMKLMSQLNHPFILDLRGVSQDNRALYMFVDFMP